MISNRLPDVELVLDRISRAQQKAVRGFRPSLPGAAGKPEGSSAEAPGLRSRSGCFGGVGTEPSVASWRRREEARALLSPETAPVDWESFGRLFEEVARLLAERAGEGFAPRYRPSGEAEGRSLLARAVEGREALETRAEELGFLDLHEADVFVLAVRYAFAPFLKACAHELRERFDPEAEAPHRCRCPVCGAEPLAAEFNDEDGRRRLACGLCGTKWRFPRLKCPFCGTDDQRNLGFLDIEGLEGLEGVRADVCEACGRYIKTLDRRAVHEPVALEVVEAMTPELDGAASSYLAERG